MAEQEQACTPQGSQNLIQDQLVDQEKSEITQALAKALELSKNSFYLTLITQFYLTHDVTSVDEFSPED